MINLPSVGQHEALKSKGLRLSHHNQTTSGGKLAGLAYAKVPVYRRGMSDASRNLFLVCYDICNPKRLYQVHKYLLGYRVGGQKSFFECWLTPAELREVCMTLKTLLDPAVDRAHIFQLDPRMKSEGMGRATAPVTTVFMII